ncbi:ABC transporter permease [Chelatococcus composti]|jgi:peptide/nickel transport system permease protein|uniref:Peptide/nickel transport system permease protein n=1 Tax=Chelatococcus composti TaxID=1743235 RepID=A0A841K8Y8_9HYPH|nr:ABC transporter permease [Chelatococcus composti]MBB6168921.1 peptide/nickel transport system permease protein [Chelatococcus composti]MBS7737524.1 ABC transporter permease [Chelatococcus composti]PZN41946.1 MAG: ABC transporter permease [Pseudomonadota bacterium]GGG43930.1 ABC transporter permease [Chelatococcus composti]
MNGVLRQFLTNPKALIGLTILALAVLVAVLAPVLAPGDPWKMAGRPFLPPLQDMRFPFGTDMMGRDIMTGLIHGARVSILVGLASTLVALVFGLLFGTLAGFYGGWLDDMLMRITEFFQTIPTFFFALLLVAILSPSIVSITLAISLVSWPPVARLVRSEFASLRGREFVRAAEVLGESNRQIILGQILPNTLSPVIAMASLMVASAILTEAAISFLGLGDPNRMSWGFMIGAARTVLRQAWWMSFFPGMAIVLVVLALNLVGDTLNDVLNPRLSRRRRQ